MVRFLRLFRTRWYRSYSPIFPILWNPKSSSETLEMVICVPGHGNSIGVPRKLANTSLITKTTTKYVNNAWIWEIDFEIFLNKPNSNSLILDGFEQSEGLDRFKRYQGTCLSAWNQLKRPKSKAASCLCCTDFLSFNRVFPVKNSTLIRVAWVVYI